MSQFFTSGGQSIGASDSASVLPMNIQDLFPLGLTGWISLKSKALSRVFSNFTSNSLASILWHSAFFIVQLSYPSILTAEKTVALIRQSFVGKVMSLLFNMLSWSWLYFQEQASFNFIIAVTTCSDFGTPQNKVSLFPLFPQVFAMK